MFTETEWHRISFKFNYNKNPDFVMALYPRENGLNVLTNIRKKFDVGTNLIYDNDDIVIEVSAKSRQLRTVENIIEILAHELTHSVGQFANKEHDALATPSKEIAHIKNNFEIDEKLFKDVKDICYISSFEEQDAFTNQFYRRLMNMNQSFMEQIEDTSEYGLELVMHSWFRVFNVVTRIGKFMKWNQFLNDCNYHNNKDIMMMLLIGYYFQKSNIIGKKYKFFLGQFVEHAYKLYIDDEMLTNVIDESKFKWLLKKISETFDNRYHRYYNKLKKCTIMVLQERNII